MYVQIIDLPKISLQTSFFGGHELVTQFASHWQGRCLKGFEFENASKKMNTSQNKILIVEFGEVKFVPAVLMLKTGLEPTTRQLERLWTTITRCDVLARK